jgi:hypothetical protein
MNTLSQARSTVAAARGKFDSTKKAFHAAEAKLRTAQGAVGDDQYERQLLLSRGGPRGAPGHKAPATIALEDAAEAAQIKLTTAEISYTTAANELKQAESALLTAENRILDRWRTVRALEIMKLQRSDADAELIAQRLAELRLMCPEDTSVRIHQRFMLSSLVRDVLGDRSDDLRLDVPVDQLRGGDHWNYETKRAEILAQAESEAHNPPLEAA